MIGIAGKLVEKIISRRLEMEFERNDLSDLQICLPKRLFHGGCNLGGHNRVKRNHQR